MPRARGGDGKRSRTLALQNRDRDGTVEAIDKSLDRIVRDIFRRRPRKGDPTVRPKKDSSLLPVDIRAEGDQRAASVIKVLPSWRKKLKGQLPDNVSEATKFHPVKRSRLACANNAQIVACTNAGFALEGREPAF